MKTFCQLYVHLVWCPFQRKPLLKPSFQNILYQYMGRYLLNHDCKPIRNNGVEDHIHLLCGYPPTLSVSKIVEGIKSSSSLWIGEKNLLEKNFSWQDGYAGFSVSKKDLARVCAYFDNQKEHHKKRSLEEEITAMRKIFNLDVVSEMDLG